MTKVIKRCIDNFQLHKCCGFVFNCTLLHKQQTYPYKRVRVYNLLHDGSPASRCFLGHRERSKLRTVTHHWRPPNSFNKCTVTTARRSSPHCLRVALATDRRELRIDFSQRRGCSQPCCRQPSSWVTRMSPYANTYLLLMQLIKVRYK